MELKVESSSVAAGETVKKLYFNRCYPNRSGRLREIRGIRGH